MKSILKVKTWNRKNIFYRLIVPFDSTKLTILNINNQVKNRASSSDKKKIKGESCGINLWQNHNIWRGSGSLSTHI